MIKVTFTTEELQSLLNLLDAGVKSIGLRSVKEGSNLLEKIEAATPQPETTTEPEG